MLGNFALAMESVPFLRWHMPSISQGLEGIDPHARRIPCDSREENRQTERHSKRNPGKLQNRSHGFEGLMARIQGD